MILSRQILSLSYLLLAACAVALSGYRPAGEKLLVTVKDLTYYYPPGDPYPSFFARVNPVSQGTVVKGSVVELRNWEMCGGKMWVRGIWVNGEPKKALHAGETGTIWLAGNEPSDTYCVENYRVDDTLYLLNPGDKPPGFSGMEAAFLSDNPEAERASLVCLLNGDGWGGNPAYVSCDYYTKGLPGLYGGKPFLSLTLKGWEDPHARCLTLVVKDFADTTGTFTCPGSLEAALSTRSGPAITDRYLQSTSQEDTASFTFSITRWQRVNTSYYGTSSVCEGRFSGTLPAISGAPEMVIKYGQFRNLSVNIYQRTY